MSHIRNWLWQAAALVALTVTALPALADDKPADQNRAIGIEGKIMDVRPDAEEIRVQTSDGRNLDIKVCKDNTWIQLEGNRKGNLGDLQQGETVSVIFYKKDGKNAAALVSEGTGGAGKSPR